MIDSTNPRIMADNILKLESKISANDVEGNPSGTGYNTLLTKIKIDSKKYKLPNQVIANPTGEATGALGKLSIDGDVYSIPAFKTLIWENSDPASPMTSLTDIDVSGYDQLELVFYHTNLVKTEIVSGAPNADTNQQVIISNYNIGGGENTYTIEQLYRTMTISEGKLSLSNGLKKKVTDGVYSTATSGSLLIPLRIYGY